MSHCGAEHVSQVKWRVCFIIHPPSTCHTGDWKFPPFANETTREASTHETPQESHLYNTGESLLMNVLQAVITPWKHESKVFLHIFQKPRVFLLFPFLSAAAYSPGLVVSVWWCNRVSVLLQQSRKVSATVLSKTQTSLKTKAQPSNHVDAPQLYVEMRWSQGRGAEMSCVSYEM